MSKQMIFVVAHVHWLQCILHVHVTNCMCTHSITSCINDIHSFFDTEKCALSLILSLSLSSLSILINLLFSLLLFSIFTIISNRNLLNYMYKADIIKRNWASPKADAEGDGKGKCYKKISSPIKNSFARMDPRRQEKEREGMDIMNKNVENEIKIMYQTLL